MKGKPKTLLLTKTTPQEWDIFLTCHADYYADNTWTPDFYENKKHRILIKRFRKIFQVENMLLPRFEQIDKAIELLEGAGIWEEEK